MGLSPLFLRISFILKQWFGFQDLQKKIRGYLDEQTTITQAEAKMKVRLSALASYKI
jgi:hypothetical protein